MNRGKFVLASCIARLNGTVRRFDEPARGTRVLMYHDVSHESIPGDIYSMPFQAFSSGVSQVAAWAAERHHNFLPFSAVPKPGIALTFDDGYSSTLHLAAPVFAAHKIPFHVFVTKSYVESGNPRYLSRAELVELAAFPGASIGLHGASHAKLSSLDDSSLHRELAESRDWLEQLIGRSVDSLSYPHGDFDVRVSNAARASGVIAAACSTVGTFTDASQALSIPRVDLWSHDSKTSTVAKTRGDWDALLP